MRAHDDRGDPRHAFVPGGYAAVFDVPTKRGLAPLVLVGPAGAFLVETVGWPGRFHAEDGKLLFEGGGAERLTHDLLRRALELKRQLLRAGVDIHVEAILVATQGTLVASHGDVEPWRIAFDYVTVLSPQDVLGFVEGQPARHPARLMAAAQAVLEGSLVGIARASGA
jgi:hypothetical protein